MNLPSVKRGPSVVEDQMNAFTLIELMIVVTIIAIVSGATIPAFSRYIRNQNLKQAQEQLKSDLRSIQNKALTGALSDQLVGSNPMKFWGIEFANGLAEYKYFISDIDTNCLSVVYQGSDNFSDSISIRSADGCIFFDISDGGISGYASPILVGYDDTATRQVLFNGTGLIYTTND